MQVVEIKEPGGPEVLHLAERPVPDPEGRELLIKVRAAGVNRPDCVQRQGNYAPPPGASDIPGLEVSGEVVAVGPDVRRFDLGDHICALVTGGGYAEYCIADERTCLPLPEGMSFVEAAAVPETFFTVWSNVFQRGALESGETLLVHGGASGIGTTAIQLGKAFGATVAASVSRPEKAELCMQLGADFVVNYREGEFPDKLREWLGDRRIDVILDITGASNFESNLSLLARDGRLVIIGLLGGAKSQINLAPIMLKRLTVTGSTLRPRSAEEKGLIAQALYENVWPLLIAKTIRPIIQKTLPLAAAREAHEIMDDNLTRGKLVLETD